MIKKHNRVSLVIGTPGFFLHHIGLIVNSPLIAGTGAFLLIIGLSYYAKAKGRSGFWGLLGIFGIFGLIILVGIKDHAMTQEEKIKEIEIKTMPLWKSLLQLLIGIIVIFLILALIWLIIEYA